MIYRSIAATASFVFILTACYAQVPASYTISTASGTSTSLAGPAGLAVDSSGNLFIADEFNNVVRKLSSGSLSSVAGNGTSGFSGDKSSATSAELNSPEGVFVDSSGNVYIADTGNYVMRKVASGNINTVAGQNTACSTSSVSSTCNKNGPATSAYLQTPTGVTVDSKGNIYIADAGYNVVWVVCTDQTPVACKNLSQFAAGDITVLAGSLSFSAGYSNDGLAAVGAELTNPRAVALDKNGNLFIADSGNNAIRKVDTKGIITTIAGGNATPGYSGDGGPAVNASLTNPTGLAIDSVGNIFIADRLNSVIRVVEPNGNIDTVAGNGGYGSGGDGGAAKSAQFAFPTGVAVSGNKIYVSDSGNNSIRLLTPVAAPPKINAGGVISVSNYGASATVAAGSWVEIYGVNLAADTRTWQQSDFTNNTAPTSLDSTSVTVGGKPAYVYFISQNQVDVQIPTNISAGTQPLVLTTSQGPSNTYNLTVATTSPGLLAPVSFKINGKQYVVAGDNDNKSTLALPTGAIAGITSTPIPVGHTMVLYGIGFGAVTPSVSAGQITPGQDTLVSPVQFSFGETPATVTYQGLAPSLVGLYQFNITVPTIPANDAVPLTLTQGGVAGTQTLYTAVAN